MDDTGATGSGGYDWENAEDLTALSGEELRRMLASLSAEERALSYRRRIVQGRIDLIRAELAGRDLVALSPQELARALMADRRGAGPR